MGTAATPYGPFEPSPEPIVCQLDLGGSIDPSPFADAAGAYLCGSRTRTPSTALPGSGFDGTVAGISNERD